MKNLYIYIYFFLFLSGKALSQYASPSFAHVKYGDGENNWLNIYLEESKQSVAVLVWAHANGKKASANDFPKKLADELNAAGVSIVSWESIPQIVTPSDVAVGERDFLLVMDWVKSNALKYKLDTSNIFISGRSRGSIISFQGVHQLSKGIKGAYFAQALPKGGWTVKDFRDNINADAPKLILAYADSPETKDGHTPLNGFKIQNRYDSLGIGRKVKVYHSLGQDNLYKHLISFIKENTK